jgi:hypothetical protein
MKERECETDTIFHFDFILSNSNTNIVTVKCKVITKCLALQISYVGTEGTPDCEVKAEY